MYRRGDPRWNRTFQHISDNLEHANETAAENLYGFTQRYVTPCVASIANCCHAATAPCLPSSSERRRNRGRTRGRAELSFDFYDDWDDDEGDGLLGWGSDSLERFLGAATTTYGATDQPGRQRPMAYRSAPRVRDSRFDAARRKSAAHARDAQDPTLIPSSSYFGFLGRLPFHLGGRGLRYKPSAADLTDHPGALRRTVDEEQPLMEDSEEDLLHHPDHDHAHGSDYKTHRRARSNTHTSGHTTDSLSSRGDIFPSEDELDDAVPLDDEFTMALERRTTGQWDDAATKSAHSSNSSTNSHTISHTHSPINDNTINTSISHHTLPSLADLHHEEDLARRDQEAQLERRRALAQQLAVQRGLLPSEHAHPASSEDSIHPGSIARTPSHEPHVPTDEPHMERPVTAVRSPRGDGDLNTHANRNEIGDEGYQDGDREGAFVPARLPNFG